jgi:glycerophosphoryl diester phosphodiesterase
VTRAAAALALLFMSTSHAIDVQGHRGARGLLPENTLPAFQRALELGVDTLELDCGVTKDGVVVAHHDRRLNPDVARGPDGKWIAAPGPTIRSLTFAELQRYDVGRIRPGSSYAARFPQQAGQDGVRIPRLEDVLRFKSSFNIETKISPDAPEETVGPEEFARLIYKEIQKAKAKATIQSFDFRTLKVVEREAPEIPTVYLTEGRYADPRIPHGAGARTWSPDFSAVDARVLKQAKDLGMRVVVWTVNEPADIARMLDLGLDGIISDYPDRVLAELKRRRAR